MKSATLVNERVGKDIPMKNPKAAPKNMETTALMTSFCFCTMALHKQERNNRFRMSNLDSNKSHVLRPTAVWKIDATARINN